MNRKNFVFVFAVVVSLATATPAQVPDKEKVVAGAERAFEKVTKAYVAPKKGKVTGMHVGASRMRDMPFVRVK